MAGHRRQAGAEPALSWNDARRHAFEAGPVLPAVRRPLEACAGTALAAPLVALSPLPPLDTSAMDGFAVAGDGPWRVVGEVLAGERSADRLRSGTAVAVGTGAAVPPGTTAVLQVELAELRRDVPRGDVPRADMLHGVVAPGRHIRRAGEECRQGEALLPAGAAVTAAVLGLAAACGHDTLEVRPRPRVVGLVTGDELLLDGRPRNGRVRDALGLQLPLLVAAHGGELVGRSHLRDDRALLRDAVSTADAEVVVTTGASSVGPADHLRGVVQDLGARLLVDGVACRPGHPQLLARLSDGRFVVGLPGNPLAALVATLTVLAPLLAGLGGRTLVRRAAVLDEAVPAAEAGTRLVPVRLEGLCARPVPHAGAGMLRGAALADALAVVPPGADLPAGAEVEVLPLS
ncbi:MAG: molybdopterin molybdotransferase MoeA [Mycobacteriales bacterium]